MSVLNNPYSKMHLTFDPARFYGRRSEVASMVLGINADMPGSFLFIGAKLIGKTSLWKYLVHERGACQEFAPLWTRCGPDGPRRAVFAYIDFYSFPEGEDFLSFLFNQLMDNKAISAIAGEACAGMEGGAQGLGPAGALHTLLDMLLAVMLDLMKSLRKFMAITARRAWIRVG